MRVAFQTANGPQGGSFLVIATRPAGTCRHCCSRRAMVGRAGAQQQGSSLRAASKASPTSCPAKLSARKASQASHCSDESTSPSPLSAALSPALSAAVVSDVRAARAWQTAASDAQTHMCRRRRDAQKRHTHTYALVSTIETSQLPCRSSRQTARTHHNEGDHATRRDEPVVSNDPSRPLSPGGPVDPVGDLLSPQTGAAQTRYGTLVFSGQARTRFIDFARYGFR